MNIENLIKNLENGICPSELNFNLEHQNEINIDWEKVAYNTFYKTDDFYKSKFPEGFEKVIPGFDKIIDLIKEKNKDNSPLKEILEKQNQEK